VTGLQLWSRKATRRRTQHPGCYKEAGKHEWADQRAGTIDRLRPSHVPHSAPATSTMSTRLTNCAIFRDIASIPLLRRTHLERGSGELLHERRHRFRTAGRSCKRVERLETRERVQHVDQFVACS
jgi:hypothetical protein